MSFTSFLQEFNRIATVAARAPLQAALARQLNQSATAARKTWPEKLENLLVLVLPLAARIDISVDAPKCLTKNVVGVQQAVSYATDYLRSTHASGFANRDYFMNDGAFVPLVALQDCAGISSLKDIKAMNVLHIFDHEIGHLVVKGGYPDFESEGHLGECAADAYAMLRHIQRFGLQSGFFEYYKRADQVVLGISPIHYTNIVNEKVKQVAESRDISRLSLRETAKLAGEIAMIYALTPAILQKISAAFCHVQACCRRLPDNDPDKWPRIFRETMYAMKLHSGNPDIVAAGKSFLLQPDNADYIKNAAAGGAYGMDDVCDFMGQFETKPVPPQIQHNPGKIAAKLRCLLTPRG